MDALELPCDSGGGDPVLSGLSAPSGDWDASKSEIEPAGSLRGV